MHMSTENHRAPANNHQFSDFRLDQEMNPGCERQEVSVSTTTQPR